MEYLVIFLFVWAAAATVLVLRGRAKLKNVMKEQQQCREKNRELYREALLWKNNRKEYRIANQFEAGLFGCLPVVELGSRTLHPVVRIEMSDEKPKLTLVGADVLAESWLVMQQLCMWSIVFRPRSMMILSDSLKAAFRTNFVNKTPSV